MRFSTHLLSLEEVWFIREHPYDIVAVKTRKLCAEIEQLEEQLESRRADLAATTTDLNERMARSKK